MTDKISPNQDPLWEDAWTWVQRQHEIGFDDAVFNAQLNQWLRADLTHRKAYDKAARIWAVAGLVPPVHGIPIPGWGESAGDGA